MAHLCVVQCPTRVAAQRDTPVVTMAVCDGETHVAAFASDVQDNTDVPLRDHLRNNIGATPGGGHDVKLVDDT